MANASSALFPALFVMRFRRPITHLIRNRPLECRLKRGSLHDLMQLVGSLWFVPVLVLVGISLFATFVSAGDSSSALRRALVCAVLAGGGVTVSGVIPRRSSRCCLYTLDAAGDNLFCGNVSLTANTSMT